MSETSCGRESPRIVVRVGLVGLVVGDECHIVGNNLADELGFKQENNVQLRSLNSHE